MDLYDDPTVVQQDPGVPAAGPNGPGYMTDGEPGSQPATVIRGWWLNGIGKEIRNVITGANLTPARSNFGQLLQAIQALISTALQGYQPKGNYQASGNYAPGPGSLYQPAGSYQPSGNYQAAGFYLTGQTACYGSAGSFNFAVPAGVTELFVEVVGGGGSGAGAGSAKSGGGGGAGGYASGLLTGLSPGAEIPFTVGAGGLASASGADGSAGGFSDVDNGALHATGGGGGLYNASTAGGPPGVGSGTAANTSLEGGDGTDGHPSGVTFAGDGGASYFGGGGRGGSGGGIGGRTPGSGGGGAYNSSGPGGAGAAGAVIFHW